MKKKQKNAEHRKGFHSLTFEFTVLFFALMAGTILVIFISNSFFLVNFYMREKQEVLNNTYYSLDEACTSGELTSDDFDVALIRQTSRNNIGIIIMDAESKTVKAYAQDTQTMMRRMWDNLLDNTDELPENFTEQDAEQWQEDSGAGSSDLQDYYIVRKLSAPEDQRAQIVLDRRTNTQYIEMWGILSDGSFYLMRSAVESIRNSSRIANRFVLYVGFFAILASLGVALWLGQRISRPIRQMTDISKRMCRLDFTAKYEGKDRNEIQELGENVNELSATLEKTISELKTANAELRSDLEHKEQIEQMQQEFISSVTHELKTPIALIQGYAEGLQDGIVEDEESRGEYIGVIIDEAGKMNTMVQKMLQLIHLEFGGVQMNVEHFDIVEAVRNYLQTAGKLASDKQIQVRFSRNGKTDQDISEMEPIMVWSDEFMSQEVFQNYFTNAVNHCEKDRIIDVRFEEKKDCCRISVFNTGSPIPEDSLPRIWERFYKVDKARTRAYGGSGVGLSIVKAIMENLHQGYGVKNYDNGVEFWFELDTAAEHEPEEKKES